MTSPAAILRRRAALVAEIAALDLALADALDAAAANDAAAPSRARRPRLVRCAPPVPLPPAGEPAAEDRQRARGDLARLGYRQR